MQESNHKSTSNSYFKKMLEQERIMEGKGLNKDSALNSRQGNNFF